MAAEELAAFAQSRGGARQRSDRFEKQHWHSQTLPTKFADVLLELWRWGRLPATLVQRIAAAAEQDLKVAYDKQLDEWTALARLGAYGQHTGNVRRDLMSKLPPPLSPDSWTARLLLWCLVSFIVLSMLKDDTSGLLAFFTSSMLPGQRTTRTRGVGASASSVAFKHMAEFMEIKQLPVVLVRE